MMAPHPAASHPPRARQIKRSTRTSVASARSIMLPSRSSRLRASGFRPSADLAGRAVALSPEVPAAFDAPLDAHHKLIGRWVLEQGLPGGRITRRQARERIEKAFDAAVMEILGRFAIADLRVDVLSGDDEGLPPAIAITCESIGQLELGWIAKSNVLSNTLFTKVAPLGWRARAYQTLVEALPAVLPIFNFGDLFEEISAYYWDGETTDEGARNALIQYHGADPEDLDDMTMPSQMKARRPDWMLAGNVAALKKLPPRLGDRIRAVRDARKALDVTEARSAWQFSFDKIIGYMPGFEDCAHLPPLTLVPFDEFARELDTVADHGMQAGFMDVAGLCVLSDASTLGGWFESLKLGVDLLRAAQDLIDFDPAKAWEPK